MNHDAAEIKRTASGHWPEILSSVAGIPADICDGRHHPCPLCNGTDRFRAFDDFKETGGVLCNQCFKEGNGDGFAAIQWTLGCDFPASVRLVAEWLDGNGAANGGTRQSVVPRIVAEYDYTDEGGELLYQSLRYDPKDFRQRRPRLGGGWDWSTKGVRQVPFRLPELIDARSDYPVFVVEGEKDVLRLAGLGCVATCNVGGADNWRPEYVPHFKDRYVVILVDNDEPGKRHGQQVAASVHGVAASVRVVLLPGLGPKQDVSDWLDQRHTLDELWSITLATPEWVPTANDESVANDWPELRPFTEPDLPTFPVDTLSALGPVVREMSRALQVSPGMVALLVLAAVSSTIARIVRIEPRAGWTEPTNLYVVAIAEPGTRKSGIHAAVLEPIETIQHERIEAATVEIAREQSERRQIMKQLEKQEKLAVQKGSDEAKREAIRLAEQLAVWPEPVLPRLVCDNITEEALGGLLASQNGRIAVASSEGGRRIRRYRRPIRPVRARPQEGPRRNGGGRRSRPVCGGARK